MRSRRRKVKIYRSVCGEIVVRGSAAQMQQKYSELSEQALSSKDVIMYYRFQQQAEHYAKINRSAQVK